MTAGTGGWGRSAGISGGNSGCGYTTPAGTPSAPSGSRGNPRPFRHRTASGFRLRPPAAQSMEIPTPWGIFTLVQEEKRDFTLFQDARKVGEIRRMLSPVKELRLTSPQEEPALFGGIVFSLACLMLHDDDFETV